MIDEAVILAAGIGSRMAAITESRPKCMAPFQGGTILGRLLRQLAGHRPRRIHVVGGHRIEVLRAYLAAPEFAGLPLQLAENPAYRETNSLVSAATALAAARGQLLILNSDVVYDPEIIRRMVASEASFAFALDRSSYSEESEKIACGRDGSAVQIAKTLLPSEAAGTSPDLYRFRNDEADGQWRCMVDNFLQRPRARRQLFEDFLDTTLAAHPFACVEVSGLEWYEIDTEPELREAEELFTRLGL